MINRCPWAVVCDDHVISRCPWVKACMSPSVEVFTIVQRIHSTRGMRHLEYRGRSIMITVI